MNQSYFLNEMKFFDLWQNPLEYIFKAIPVLANSMQAIKNVITLN